MVLRTNGPSVDHVHFHIPCIKLVVHKNAPHSAAGAIRGERAARTLLHRQASGAAMAPLHHPQLQPAATSRGRDGEKMLWQPGPHPDDTHWYLSAQSSTKL